VVATADAVAARPAGDRDSGGAELAGMNAEVLDVLITLMVVMGCVGLLLLWWPRRRRD